MKINILSVFLHTLSTKQEYMPTILHILLEISINNHPLLHIHINPHNNYDKKYAWRYLLFYYDTHKIIKKNFFSCIYKNGPTKYYVLQKPG